MCERRAVAAPVDSDEVRARAHELWREGDQESAIEVLSSFLGDNLGDCLAFNDLGVLLFLRSEYLRAENSFACALHFDPEFPAALRGRGEALLRLHRYAEALDFLERYRRSDSASVGPKLSHVECLSGLGRLTEALKLAEECLKENRESVRLWMLLATIYQRQRLPGKLVSSVEAAVGLKPESVHLRAQLALAYWEFGRTEEAFRERDWVVRASGKPKDLQFNLSWLSLHDPNQTAYSLREAHRAVTADWAPTPPPGLTRVSSMKNRKLRIGYVSGEFAGGPAFCFLASWLKYFDRSRYHSTFYSSRSAGSRKAAVYKELASQWRNIAGLSTTELENLIKQDRLDILVDFSGHYDGNRLEVFRRRAAPIQVTFPNYPGTTGVEQIDYIFTDLWATPHGSESDYVETPYRLPSGYLAYEPPEELPAVELPPSLKNGFATFGLFQRPGKYHAQFWDVAGAVMRANPTSRLLVHFASAELDDDASEQCRFLAGRLAERGVSRHRLRFVGERKHSEHLRIVAEADVALDSFPYNGQTTTCDCLWMGVPVVTLRGHTHVSRVGSSLLHRMRLGNLVADSREGYIRTAVDLSLDLARLVRLRDDLRNEAQKYLGNGARLAEEISQAYRWMTKRGGMARGASATK